MSEPDDLHSKNPYNNQVRCFGYLRKITCFLILQTLEFHGCFLRFLHLFFSRVFPAVASCKLGGFAPSSLHPYPFICGQIQLPNKT